MPKKKELSELEPGSTAWMNALSALSPQDQAALFGANTSNYNFEDTTSSFDQPEGFADFGGGSGVGLPGTGYTLPPGFEGIGMDPQTQGLLQFGGGVNIPTLSAKGVVEPYDLPQEAARVNLMQDNATSIADIILSSLAGPGALDPASFAPVVTAPTERISTPGLTQLDRYAQGTGYKAFVAKKIRDEGATDDEALADLYNYISAPDDPSISDSDRAARQEIVDSLPSAFNSGNQINLPSGTTNRNGGPERTSQDARSMFDESNISKWANDLYFKVADDQANVSVGYQDPKTGFWYKDSPVEEDSAATTKFKNLGLPTPFAAYNDPKYLQMAYDASAPNLDASMQAREQNITDTQAAQDRAFQESRGPIDRNIETQKLLRQTGGYQAAPPPPPVVNNPASPGRTMGATLSYGTNPGGGTTAGGALPPQTPQFSPNNAIDTVGQAAATPRPRIQGIQNPQGGFDFGQAHGAEQQAMVNHLLNFVGGVPFGGGSNRGTKVVSLNAATGKKSQKEADTARRAYTDANTRRYQASQASTPDLAAAVRALATANVAADSGRTPFKDVVMQRLLGQRAVGVRGL